MFYTKQSAIHRHCPLYSNNKIHKSTVSAKRTGGTRGGSWAAASGGGRSRVAGKGGEDG